jgi:hypothetical protein
MAGHVLKSNEIIMNSDTNSDSNSGQDFSSNSQSGLKARIVEQTPQFAVIEINCSCGTKTYLRCEYA